MDCDKSIRGGAPLRAAEEDGEVLMEAAEALAALAEAINNDVSTGFTELERPIQSLMPQSSPPEDRAVTQHFCNNASTTMKIPVKIEENTEASANQTCTTNNHSISSSRSRKHLTEAEKEARKLRRILANRESARQTIRRRQAMYIDLTRKAADLTVENQKLKREKELAVREHDSLKQINERLKAQINMAQGRDTQEESKPYPDEKSTSTCARSSFLLYNQPPMISFLWPSIAPPDAFQSRCSSNSDTAMPSQPPLQPRDVPLAYRGQENSIRNNRGLTPFLVLPFPWFVPVQTSGNVIRTELSPNGQKNEASLACQSSTFSSPKTVVRAKKHFFSSIPNVKTESSTSTKASQEDHHEGGFGYSLDAGTDHAEACPRGTILTPTPLSCVRSVQSLDLNKNLNEEDTSDYEDVSSHSVRSSQNFPEKSQDLATSPSGKSKGAIMAAEARRRRKELMKLKNVHYNYNFIHH